MSKIKEVLRLKYLNQLSNRQIQTITGVSRNSVANYVNCFIELEASLEDILELTEPDLEQLFHPNKSSQTAKKAEVSLIHPDWNNVRVELSKKGMTRALLYEEYKNVQPELYSYSQFNRYYAKFLKSINPSMRQNSFFIVFPYGFLLLYIQLIKREHQTRRSIVLPKGSFMLPYRVNY